MSRASRPFAPPVRITIMSRPRERWHHNPAGQMSRTETSTTMAERIAALDWRGIAAALDAHGCAVVRALVSVQACTALAASYDVEDAFRSRIVMARHGFGRGEYQYFPPPPPPPVRHPPTP